MKTLLIIITILMSVSLAGAEMYKWVADDGSVIFKDTPPPTSQKYKTVKIYNDIDYGPAPVQEPTPESASAESSSKSAAGSTSTAPAKKERFSGTVEIYVTDWCRYCKDALSYMSSKGIKYVSYNIDKDSRAKQRYKELGGKGVPLIIIGSNKMSGFSPNNLEHYLNNSK